MTTEIVYYVDFETRSTVDLKRTGIYPYAESFDTDVWLMAYGTTLDDVRVWYRGQEMPADLRRHIERGGTVSAWNAGGFERHIWREIMVKRYGWPAVLLEQWNDTAALAAVMALPRGLDEAARVLKLTQRKDQEGYRLMLRMMRPKRIDENGDPVWEDDPEKIVRLGQYCADDVRGEIAVGQKLQPLSKYERKMWELDQRMNDRGIGIDIPVVRGAKLVVEEGVKRANRDLTRLTGGAVDAVTNHTKLRHWLIAQGIETDSVAKKAVRELLDGELTEAVREALTIRKDTGKSAVAKLNAMEAWAARDSRAHGTLLYSAASTGRWAGKGVQPQNMFRPEYEQEQIEAMLPLVERGDFDALAALGIGHPIGIVASSLRAMIVAQPGHRYLAADYSGIEAVVTNWLADEQAALANFRRYFAGEKQFDPYIQNAMHFYKLPFEEILKFPHRQMGKFIELGCGFGMGAPTGVRTAKDVYGLTITLEESKAAVDFYRETHANVKQMWSDLNDDAMNAVQNPGRVVTTGMLHNLKMLKTGDWLVVQLPSGRRLWYAAPRIIVAAMPWSTDEKPDYREQVEISAVNGYTRKWGRERMYGGKWMENVVQAAARDILADGTLRADMAGYPPVLLVHDEVVSEPVVGHGTLAEFETILRTPPEWAKTCPINTEGWEGMRYRK